MTMEASTDMALEDRLQGHLPFLRQMLSNLNPECQQHKKIKALCDIIDKSKKVKQETLEKCEKVILLLQTKTKRPGTSVTKIKSEPHKSPPESKMVDIRSPSPEPIRSPSPISSTSESITDRYVNDRPSIYAAAGETISPAPQKLKTNDSTKIAGIEIKFGQIVVDSSEPLIPAEELALLQAETTSKDKDSYEDASRSSRTNSHSEDIVTKSKVSLVPAPFHKRRASTKGGERATKDDLSNTSQVTKSSKSGNSGSKVEQVKIVDGDSIFGNLLSSLDNKLISEKQKVSRRDSKDSKDSNESSRHKHSSGKDSDKQHELRKLHYKIKDTEKLMHSELKKEGLKKEQVIEITKKYNEKIRRYKQSRDALLKECDVKGKDKPRHERRSSKSNERDNANAKDNKDNSSTVSLQNQLGVDYIKKLKSKVDQNKQRGFQKVQKSSAGKVDSPPPFLTPSPLKSKSTDDLISNGSADSPKVTLTNTCSVPNIEGSPVSTVTLPSCTSSSPRSDSSFEIRTPSNPFSSYIPRRDFSFDATNTRGSSTEVGYSEEMYRSRPDPRLRTKSSPPPRTVISPKLSNPDPFAPNYMDECDTRDKYPDRPLLDKPAVFDPFQPQPIIQPSQIRPMGPRHPYPGPRIPSRDHWVRGNSRPMPQVERWIRPLGPEFHPFDPITPVNEYDLSKMPSHDFYTPPTPSIPNNYKQWRELKRRDEERKRMISLNEYSDVRHSRNKDKESDEPQKPTETPKVNESQTVHSDTRQSEKEVALAESAKEQNTNTTIISVTDPKSVDKASDNENKDTVHPEDLLKILNEAKKNADGGAYLPTRIVEMVESLLQKQNSIEEKEKSTASAIISDPHVDSTHKTNSDDAEVGGNETNEKDKELRKETVNTETESSDLVAKEKMHEERVTTEKNTKTTNKKNAKLTKEKQPATDSKTENVKGAPKVIEQSAHVSTVPPSVSNTTSSSKNKSKEPKNDNLSENLDKTDETAASEEPEKIVTRLRRRTKEINYNEVKILMDATEVAKNWKKTNAPKEKKTTTTIAPSDHEFSDTSDSQSASQADETESQSATEKNDELSHQSKENSPTAEKSNSTVSNDPETTAKNKSDESQLDNSNVASAVDTSNEKSKENDSIELESLSNDGNTDKTGDNDKETVTEESQTPLHEKEAPEVKSTTTATGKNSITEAIMNVISSASITETLKKTPKKVGRPPKNKAKDAGSKTPINIDKLVDIVSKSLEIDEEIASTENAEPNVNATKNEGAKKLPRKQRIRKTELALLEDNMKDSGNGLYNSKESLNISMSSKSDESDFPTLDDDNAESDISQDFESLKKKETSKKFKKSPRVMLEKLDFQESILRSSTPVSSIGAPPTRQRLARASKAAVVSYNENTVRTPEREKGKKDDSDDLSISELSNTSSNGLTPSATDKKSAKRAQNETSSRAKKSKKETTPKDTIKKSSNAKSAPNKAVQLSKPDKEYFLKSDTSLCKLCDFSGSQIVQHYVNDHPESETLVSRLSPEATEEAVQESLLNGYESITAINLGAKRLAKFDFRCRFCAHDLQKEHTATFYDHVSSHTGEARYHCTECPYKYHLKHTVKVHILFEHGKKDKEPTVDASPVNFDKLFGYICSECNFLQLQKDAIDAHVNKYHQNENVYVYTVNMSLPILQRSNRGRKNLCEEMKEDNPLAQRKSLRNSTQAQCQSNKTPEEDEPNVKSLIKTLSESSDAVVEFNLPEHLLNHHELSSSDENNTATTEPDADDITSSDIKPIIKAVPNSAFVLEHWDDSLSAPKETPQKLPQTPTKRSNFVDTLKKRFDDALKNGPTTEKEDEIEPVTRLLPIDTEFTCTSEMNTDETSELKMEVEEDKENMDSEEVKSGMKHPELIDTVSKEDKELKDKMPCNPVTKPSRKILSVSIVDALIDTEYNVSYFCRKPLCIFQTSARRVLSAHFNYTHQNCLDELVCNVCQKNQSNIRMLDIFTHLCEHVDSFLEEKRGTKVAASAVKVEPTETKIIDSAHPLIEITPEVEKTPPPKLAFKIVKVESLASSADSVSTQVTPISFANSAITLTSPSTIPITCKIVPMSAEEIKSDRKNAKVMRKWIEHGLTHLFKCPEYDCEFFTVSETAFDSHLQTHDFKDMNIPCLYCNFKMRKEYIKVHLMMRHVHCKFGCGHCLYRAVKAEYVKIHQEEVHPWMSKEIKPLSPPVLLTRYRPPSLPPLTGVLKPYPCACKRNFYCTSNFEFHLNGPCKSLRCTICNLNFKKASLLITHFELTHKYYEFGCRYCEFGDKTETKILKHIAMQHPFHEVGIIKRQEKNHVPSDVEAPDIINRLILLNDSNSNPLSPISAGIKSNSSVTINSGQTSVVSDAKVVPRLMLIHPIILGPGGKTTSLIVPTTPTTAVLATTSPKLITTSALKENIMIVPSIGDGKSLAENKKGDDIFKCNQCETLHKNSEAFIQHIIGCNDKVQLSKPFICYHCKKSYKSANALSEHIRIHGVKNLICGLCNQREPNIALLRKHFKIIHKLTNVQILPVDPTKKNIDVDEFIGKPFKSQTPKLSTGQPEISTIKLEDETNFGPEDIASLPMCPIFKFVAKCKNCDFFTKVRSNFIRHMSLHSTGKIDPTAPMAEAVNPVPCLEKNELMFDKMINLAASSCEAGGRMGKGPIKLDDDLIGFKAPEHIAAHKRYVCGAAGCNYLCLEEQILRHHLQALHDNEQTYKCIHCQEALNPNDGKSFIDIDAIINHLRLHENNLYKCGNCDYINSGKPRIEKHHLEKHADKVLKVIIIRQEIDESESEKQKRNWCCGVCPCRKTNEDDIKAHIKDKHSLHAQYKCTYCSFRDDSADSFENHFASNHANLSPDIIVAYFKEEEKEKEDKTEKKELFGPFDTTPLWLKNRNAIKHIRGILLDEDENAIKKAKIVSGVKPGPPKVVSTNAPIKRKLLAKPVEPNLAVNKKPRIEIRTPESINGSSLKLDAISTKLSTSCPPSLTVIEIPDDDPILEKALAKEQSNKDPSLLRLTTMPIHELMKSTFDSTYGPLGTPNDTKFSCPLCNVNDFTEESAMKAHLYEELQYNKYGCAICEVKTTSFKKLEKHYSEKHLALCENDSIRVDKNPSIENWISKVLEVQRRIILHNSMMKNNTIPKKKPAKQVKEKSDKPVVAYQCFHCKYTVSNRNVLVAHSKAAHPKDEVNIQVKFIELK